MVEPNLTSVRPSTESKFFPASPSRSGTTRRVARHSERWTSIDCVTQVRIPDHADQRSDRMPIIDSGPWRSGFRTMAITDSGLIPIS